MSDSSQPNSDRSWLRLLTWPLLIGFVFLSMAMAVQWLLSLKLDSGFLDLLSYQWLLMAVSVQMLTALVMVISWRLNLRLHGLGYISISQSTVLIGLNSIGKYTPGKVLGIIARGSALYKMSGDGRLVLQTTLVEQVALLHSGAAVALLAWLMNSGNNLFAWLLLPIIVASVFIISYSGDLLLNVVSRLAKKHQFPSEAGPGFKRSYGAIFLMMKLVWVLSAFALYFCVAAYEPRDIFDFWWLLWIITLAYMAGFLAVFTPAGLGAREGVMVIMLSTQMDTSVALYISILHRLITVLIDILLGAYSLLCGRELVVSK
jgi:glycosyltransferase 2 family protein